MPSRHRAARLRGGRAIVLLVACVSACSNAAGQAPTTTSQSVVEPVTSVPPTTVAKSTPKPAEVYRWPLTGKPADQGLAEAQNPAVVVKIDNDPAARPQVGINQADLVYELRVEGISRFAAVFHQNGAHPVGPVRSARTSDIDLIANLRTPLFAFSGGNGGVLAGVRRAQASGAFLDSSHDARKEHYWRDRSRRGPHNLFTDTTDLIDSAPPEMGPPLPLFRYGDSAAVAARGQATPGAWVGFSGGSTVSAEYAWDSRSRSWRRFQVDRLHPLDESAHVDSNGLQIAPTNLVILEVDYRRSPADSRSPEAVSLGSGRAQVFVEGRLVAGTWNRERHSDTWGLRDEAGKPILLSPGRTWVALVAPGGWGALTQERAAELLAHVPV